MLAGALDGKEAEGELLSYEGPFGVGYAVAEFHQLRSRYAGPYDRTGSRHDRRMRAGSPHTRLARTSLIIFQESCADACKRKRLA